MDLEDLEFSQFQLVFQRICPLLLLHLHLRLVLLEGFLRPRFRLVPLLLEDAKLVGLLSLPLLPRCLDLVVPLLLRCPVLLLQELQLQPRRIVLELLLGRPLGFVDDAVRFREGEKRERGRLVAFVIVVVVVVPVVSIVVVRCL